MFDITVWRDKVQMKTCCWTTGVMVYIMSEVNEKNSNLNRHIFRDSIQYAYILCLWKLHVHTQFVFDHV